MPTPVAHSIVGLTISSTSKYGKIFNNKVLNLILIVFVSVVPDLDLIPGIFTGVMFKYHHGVSHSFFFAIVFGFLLSLIIFIFPYFFVCCHIFLSCDIRPFCL